MTKMYTESIVELTDRVFDLLKRRGPLCTSQLSAELMVGAQSIDGALELLRQEGVVEPRPDRDQTKEIERPWGLRKPSFSNLAR